MTLIPFHTKRGDSDTHNRYDFMHRILYFVKFLKNIDVLVALSKSKTTIISMVLTVGGTEYSVKLSNLVYVIKRF